MTRRSILITAIAVIIAAAILFVIAHEQSRNNARRAAAEATTTTGVTSPYDMSEVSGKLDLDILENSSFVSILVPNADGKPTSYMADAGGSAARALIQATRDAVEMKSAPSPGSSGETITSTLTFVLPSRQTITFTLDVDAGLLYRQSQAWRPNGDLQVLITAATTAPQQ